MTALAAVPDRIDTKALTAEATQLVTDARALTITDAETFAKAAEFGKGVKALQKKIVAFFADHKKRSYDAWKGLCDDESRQLAPTNEAERIVKDKLLEFQRAEKKRLDEENRKREIEARQQEEERRMQEALDLDEDGDRAGAEAVLAAPIPLPVVRVPTAPLPKVAGVAPSKRWTFDEPKVDVDAVIKHIAGIPQDQKLAHPELRRLLALDAKTTRQLITSMRENFNVPGIPAYEAEGISLGSK